MAKGRAFRGFKIKLRNQKPAEDTDKTGVQTPAARPPTPPNAAPPSEQAAPPKASPPQSPASPKDVPAGGGQTSKIPPPANDATQPKREPVRDETPADTVEGIESHPTLRINRGLSAMSDLMQLRRMLAEPLEGEYTVLPVRMQDVPRSPEKPRWRIDLWFEDPAKEPLKLEIADVTVLGRKVKADLDLDPHDAVKYGISRQHAMMRPSPNALYFFDLESTNGTQCNGVPVGPGVACALAVNDVIKLGTLRLTVRRLERI